MWCGFCDVDPVYFQAKQVDQDMNRTVKNVEDSAENTVSALTYLLLECAGV
jgi:hypothetical protein